MEQEGEFQEKAARLELTAAQEIHKRTFGRIQDLRVELINGQLVVRGSTNSYYVKSLALEAAQEVRALVCPIPLLVDIHVN